MTGSRDAPQALGDEAVAALGRLGRVQDEHGRVAVDQAAAVDRRPHPRRQAVGGALEAGQVEQHRPPPLAVDDRGDAAPGGLRPW